MMTFLAAGQRAPPSFLVLSNTERKDKIKTSRKGKNMTKGKLFTDDDYLDGQREELAAQRDRWEKVRALATELRAAADAYIDLAVCDLPGAGANASDRSDNFAGVEHLLLNTLASIRFPNADEPWKAQLVRDWLASSWPITERIRKEFYAELEKSLKTAGAV
jgi:hypothetical protein